MTTSANNDCKLTLYYRDLRTPTDKNSRETQTPDIKESGDKVYDAVFKFFNLTDPADKELFQTAISHSPCDKRSIFYRKDSPQLMHGIEPVGNPKLLEANTKRSFQPINRPDRNLSLAGYEGPVLIKKRLLSFKDLASNNEVFHYPEVVSLYNSNFNFLFKLDLKYALCVENTTPPSSP